MKIFFAGSFPRITTPPLESELATTILSTYLQHRRLYSFYYSKETNCAIKQLREANLIDSEEEQEEK